ncbi:oligopeptide/dipeptide ABC transporter, ATP-binding protein [Halogeometricum borinquense DSM 11551]|uniref:Oligopeptide/dipeptide ABC transporter, ATP-binding protein n=1 Tax=Halogeometricum borinquense (strain ATCC 700274 / DSM 11551 / JCM 10706 / KCTC 4070 / PR3) TaxID=469382 RepID=E4NWP1_HALBP|nr:ABC transporter ATP-binding protein [Halogeometricum borinquense]ADQ69461.1 oligopeptide/dipeptide ABC transporter, ATP-binding protein [Halogeometricum borinquense DSM 11551]ELY25769.1 oligopeptide/dipeptide ABC transporter, ATP-binding protein [Halogeometricum borinquense DSM 11551]
MANQREELDGSLSVDDPILSLRNASVTFDEGNSFVLNDVSLDLGRGEILGIVGESGSGKSMLAEAMLDAIPDPGVLQGEIIYRPDSDTDIDILELNKNELRSMRWEQISMVFQGAMSSFNPTMKVGAHFRETIQAHDADVKAGMSRAREALADVYLDPERVLDSYPHELSGGMQQRALIALSIVLEPDILVMDEPTAALDLLMQRSILLLLEDLKEKYDLTMVFITHDLPLVAALADRMAIMYAFDLVEAGPTDEIIDHAAHPYTRALLNSTPNLDAPLEEMRPIAGQSPAPINVPSGCSYHPRCPLADEQCRSVDPHFHDTGEAHGTACFHWQQARDDIELNYKASVSANPNTPARGDD